MSVLKIGEVLELKHVTNVIVCLMVRGPMRKTEIYKHTSTNPRMARKLDILEEKGIVEMSSEGNSTYVSLTNAGMSLGRALCEAEVSMYGGMTDGFRSIGAGGSPDIAGPDSEDEGRDGGGRVVDGDPVPGPGEHVLDAQGGDQQPDYA